MVTTSRSAGEWAIVMNDVAMAGAVLNRFLHHCKVLTMRGDSYRLREARRDGVLKGEGTLPGSGSATGGK